MNKSFTRKQAYESLCAELAAIEKTTGLYLTDTNIDIQNVVEAEGSEFTHADLRDHESGVWCAMSEAAASAAGSRAEDAGECINGLIGRVIY